MIIGILKREPQSTMVDVQYTKFICDRCERSLEVKFNPDVPFLSGWQHLIGINEKQWHLCSFCSADFFNWVERK